MSKKKKKTSERGVEVGERQRQRDRDRQTDKMFRFFNVPSTTLAYLRINHTFRIRLRQFKTQVATPQAESQITVSNTTQSAANTTSSKANQ